MAWKQFAAFARLMRVTVHALASSVGINHAMNLAFAARMMRSAPLWKDVFSGLTLAKQDGWVWRNDNLFFGLLEVFRTGFCLAGGDGPVAQLAVVPFAKVNGETDDPCDDHDAATNAPSENGRECPLAVVI